MTSGENRDFFIPPCIRRHR